MKCEGIRRGQVWDPFCSPHTGRKSASSQEYRGLDQQTVELYLKNGRSTGFWIPLINDCNTLPKDIIRNADNFEQLGCDSMRIPNAAVQRTALG
jgi:hypothetical protein